MCHLGSRAIRLAVCCTTLLCSGAARATPAAPVRQDPTGDLGGIVVLLHGGGWTLHGAKVTRELSQSAGRTLAKWGYRSISVDYSAGRHGLADVLAAVDRLHARSPRLPLCVAGVSAGGHWALMAAAERSWLRCVVATAAPTDVATPQRVAPTSYLGATGADVFGALGPRYSPLFMADRISAEVLLAYSMNDPLVPFIQGAAMARALGARSTFVAMPAGSVSWGHSNSTGEAIANLETRTRTWMETVMSAQRG